MPLQSKHSLFIAKPLLAGLLLSFYGLAWSGSLQRISTTTEGAQPTGNSRMPSITPDGRYVLFSSEASDLVENDGNSSMDVFLKDRKTGKITRVSLNDQGDESAQFYDSSNYSKSALTPDAKYVVFHSGSYNFAANDNNDAPDVFLKNLKTNALTRVSTNAQGQDTDGGSDSASISANGRYVAFRSVASNLVAGDDNSLDDIFVKDVKTGAINRVSTDSQGGQANGPSYQPLISSNGRYVLFQSTADNLVENDTNGVGDVFLKDLKTGKINRVSTSSSNGEANKESYDAVMTGNARYVAFASDADNLVANDGNNGNNGCDVFRKDLKTGKTIQVSLGEGGGVFLGCYQTPSISNDGRYVAFSSEFFGRSNVLLKDLKTTALTMLSFDKQAGEQGNNDSYNPVMASKGRYCAFYSFADNLIAGDSNNVADVFLYDFKGKP